MNRMKPVAPSVPPVTDAAGAPGHLLVGTCESLALIPASDLAAFNEGFRFCSVLAGALTVCAGLVFLLLFQWP